MLKLFTICNAYPKFTLQIINLFALFLKVVSKIPFVVMTGFAFLLFGITFMYWNFRPDVNFLLFGKFAADLVFYLATIGAYELRKRYLSE